MITMKINILAVIRKEHGGLGRLGRQYVLFLGLGSSGKGISLITIKLCICFYALFCMSLIFQIKEKYFPFLELSSSAFDLCLSGFSQTCFPLSQMPGYLHTVSQGLLLRLAVPQKAETIS